MSLAPAYLAVRRDQQNQPTLIVAVFEDNQLCIDG